MTQITIYHNPRCSKSRQTLELLQEKNITPEIILYLDTPPSRNEIRTLLGKLGISARELIRKSEEDYKTLNLSDAYLSEDDLLDALASHPRLIERPIVVSGNKAVLGRPPENVLTLI
jgi:arsenate reductase